MANQELSKEFKRRVLNHLKSRAGDTNPVGATAKAVGVSRAVVNAIAQEADKGRLDNPLKYKTHKARKDGLRRVVIKSVKGTEMTWWTDRDDDGIETFVRQLEKRLNDDSPGSAFTIS